MDCDYLYVIRCLHIRDASQGIGERNVGRYHSVKEALAAEWLIPGHNIHT